MRLLRNKENFMKKNLLNKTIAFSLAVLFTAIACACGVPVDEPAQSTASLVLPTATPAPRPVSGGEVRMPMPVNADVSDPVSYTHLTLPTNSLV